MSARQKLSETESTFAFVIGGGITLLMLGFGIAGMNAGTTDNTFTNGMMIIGVILFVAGSIGWALVTQPWLNFDNWSKPAYTGHEHDSHDTHDHHDEVVIAEPDPHAVSVEPEASAHPARAEYEHPVPVEPAVAVQEPAASASPTGKRDDLQVIEGIGPKIATALYDAGVETYAHLAAMPASDVERIVRTAGVRMVGHAESWVDQAKLAAAGKMAELEAMQKEMNSRKGKE